MFFFLLERRGKDGSTKCQGAHRVGGAKTGAKGVRARVGVRMTPLVVD